MQGTVQYLSPEQIRGEPADPRSDLYSLGIVTYELLTGRLPFTGETAMSIAYKHLSGRVPKPSTIVPTVPAELDGFVLSATERDREMRPESAGEMRRDLGSIVPSLPSARSLASVVGDLPEVHADGDATEQVLLVATTTQTIPRAERIRHRRGRRFAEGFLLLAALAAIAWGVWTYVIPHHADIPRLVGTPMGQARTTLEDLGFTVKVDPVGVYRLGIPAGDVAQVHPTRGRPLEKGAVVTLVRSLGAPLVPVPVVSGHALAEAKQLLLDAKLQVGAVRHAYSATEPKGTVISQSSSGTAPEHEGIDLVVSKGQKPVAVPPVVNQTEADAVAALTHAGFKPNIVRVFSKSVINGYVISEDPAAGVLTPLGNSVTIKVSRGPAVFQLRSYIGMTESAAIAAITADGLVPNVQPIIGGVTGRVVGQDPIPGTIVHAGDTITISVA